MIEIIKKILLAVPRRSEIYIFGSALTSLVPNDLDVLVIYDSHKYPKATIYIVCEKISGILKKNFNLDVHLTVLSYLENREKNFIEEINAIKLEDFLREKLCR